MSDATELLYYLLGFWRFVLSSKFRHSWLKQFNTKSFGEKLIELLGVSVGTVIGLGIPIIVAILIYDEISFFQQVDSCLDQGGSYSYEECTCDFLNNHKVVENHQCK
jgi:hypothetical protein